jgi:hypothetical protein
MHKFVTVQFWKWYYAGIKVFSVLDFKNYFHKCELNFSSLFLDVMKGVKQKIFRGLLCQQRYYHKCRKFKIFKI